MCAPPAAAAVAELPGAGADAAVPFEEMRTLLDVAETAAAQLSTFNERLASRSELVEARRGEFDHELRLRPVGSEPAA